MSRRCVLGRIETGSGDAEVVRRIETGSGDAEVCLGGSRGAAVAQRCGLRRAAVAHLVMQRLGHDQQLLRVAKDGSLLVGREDLELVRRARIHGQHHLQVGNVLGLGPYELRKAILAKESERGAHR